MESVVRSFPSVEPVCLRWNWPLWNRDDNLNPEDLDGKAEPKMPKRGTEAAVETDMMIARVRELVNPKKPESKRTNSICPSPLWKTVMFPKKICKKPERIAIGWRKSSGNIRSHGRKY